MDQEAYLKQTLFKDIIVRGVKKMITELSSIKTLFLTFICIAMAYGWIGDMAGIIGGLATLGVKEIPSEVFTAIIQKIIPSPTSTIPDGGSEINLSKEAFYEF